MFKPFRKWPSSGGGGVLSPDFTLLTGAGYTTTISVWGTDTKATEQISKKVSDPIVSMVLSFDRTLAASYSVDGIIRVWNMDTYSCIHEFNDRDQRQIRDSPLRQFQFTQDGKHLFVSKAPTQWYI